MNTSSTLTNSCPNQILSFSSAHLERQSTNETQDSLLPDSVSLQKTTSIASDISKSNLGWVSDRLKPSTAIASPGNIAPQASKNSDHSATDQIAVLLKYLGENVNGLGRDVQMASQVFHRSRIVYEAIHELLTDGASQDSTRFDTYTTAISRLEKQVLLNVFHRNFKYLTYSYFLDFF